MKALTLEQVQDAVDRHWVADAGIRHAVALAIHDALPDVPKPKVLEEEGLVEVDESGNIRRVAEIPGHADEMILELSGDRTLRECDLPGNHVGIALVTGPCHVAIRPLPDPPKATTDTAEGMLTTGFRAEVDEESQYVLIVGTEAMPDEGFRDPRETVLTVGDAKKTQALIHSLQVALGELPDPPTPKVRPWRKRFAVSGICSGAVLYCPRPSCPWSASFDNDSGDFGFPNACPRCGIEFGEPRDLTAEAPDG
jgi:hypothetical protein